MMNLLLVCCLIGIVSSEPALQTQESDLLRELLEILKKDDVTDEGNLSNEKKGIPLEGTADDNLMKDDVTDVGNPLNEKEEIPLQGTPDDNLKKDDVTNVGIPLNEKEEILQEGTPDDNLKKDYITDVGNPLNEKEEIPLEGTPDDNQSYLQDRGFSSCVNVGRARICLVGRVKDNCVNAHNIARKFHKSPKVSWNAALAKDAAKWAKKLATENKWEHSENRNYGENLYWYSSSSKSVIYCANAVLSWYEEYKKYNYASPGFSSGTGHFTQVVWKSSTEIGCGIAKKVAPGSTQYYIVCRYKPAGNMRGRYSDNVKKPYPTHAQSKEFSHLM